MKITTNHNRREIIDGFELTASEREQFDYLDWARLDEGRDSASFFRYRGELYDLGNFMRNSAPEGWDAGVADSAFSGIVVKLANEDGEDMIIVGTYYY